MHDVLDPCDTVPDEVEQLLTSGHRIPAELVARVRAAADAGDRDLLRGLLPRLTAVAERPADWGHHEPEELPDILAAMRRSPAVPHGLTESELADRVLGAWLARCAGCCVGKPVEGLTPEQVRGYLRAADAWPLRGYVPLLDPLPGGIERLNPSWETATLGRVQGMPRDDDTDYTVLALHVVETHGRGFTRADIAHQWQLLLPFLQTFTAERATYRNLVGGVEVERAGTHENPYREWIGALIRADLFGYVNPGDPESAARMAFADASLSHTANGVYGEMWAAALIAGAFTAPDAVTAVRRSVDWIPTGSRLFATVAHVLAAYDDGATWEDVIGWVDQTFADHSWVHTLNNAAIIAAGLLWGDEDVAASIGLTVMAGLDTDSSAATVGSVLGALHGATALPAHLVEPLHDRLSSAVHGYDGSRISELAGRTLALVPR